MMTEEEKERLRVFRKRGKYDSLKELWEWNHLVTLEILELENKGDERNARR